MQWNNSALFRGVYFKGDNKFSSVGLLPWRSTVLEVIADLKAIRAGYLTFIRNERHASSLPYKAKDATPEELLLYGK